MTSPKSGSDRSSIVGMARKYFEPLGGRVIEDRQYVEVALPAHNIRKAADIIRSTDELDFKLLCDVSGLHWPDSGELELVYHFFGVEHAEGLVLRVRVPEKRPEVPSIAIGWPTANWHEREAMDMFGFKFEGHPYPERLLIDEDEIQGALLKSHQVRNEPDVRERFRERAGRPFRLWNPARPEVKPMDQEAQAD